MPAFLVHRVPDTHIVWYKLCDQLSRADVVPPGLSGYASPLPALEARWSRGG